MSDSKGICIEKKGTTWKMTIGMTVITAVITFLLGIKLPIVKTDGAEITQKFEEYCKETNARMKVLEEGAIKREMLMISTKESFEEIKKKLDVMDERLRNIERGVK